MGQSKRPRPKKKTSAAKIVKWIVIAALVGAAGYGLSQMPTVAYGESAIKVVDFSGLNAAQKRHALEDANTARCTCGCGMTLAQCVATDSTCPIREDNIAQIRRIVEQAMKF